MIEEQEEGPPFRVVPVGFKKWARPIVPLPKFSYLWTGKLSCMILKMTNVFDSYHY